MRVHNIISFVLKSSCHVHYVPSVIVAIIFGPMVIFDGFVCLAYNIGIMYARISWKTSLPQSVLPRVMLSNGIIIIGLTV